MLSACRTAVLAGKTLGWGAVAGAGAVDGAGGGAAAGAAVAGEVEVDFRRAFWTATLGGAHALGLEEHLGSFAAGKQFDAVVVDAGAGAYDAFAEALLDATPLPSDFERYCNLGDDRQVHTVFVRGKAVFTGVGAHYLHSSDRSDR